MKKTITSFFVLVVLLGAFSRRTEASTLNLKFYLEGNYAGNGTMYFSCGVKDAVLVELHDPVSPSIIVTNYNGTMQTNGTIACTFSNTIIGNAYYIVIKHRNALQTWSAAPVTINAVTNYDFSSAATQAYASNMVKVDNVLNLWAFYTGDLNYDENIDLADFPPLDLGINTGFFGCVYTYKEDLNGDGNIDLLDFPVLNANINAGIFSRHP